MLSPSSASTRVRRSFSVGVGLARYVLISSVTVPTFLTKVGIGPAGLHLLHHIGGGQGQVTHGVAQHGVTGLEALNAFLLGGDGAQIGMS